jgi:two-component system nitrate/nitrite response regulator NarL
MPTGPAAPAGAVTAWCLILDRPGRVLLLSAYDEPAIVDHALQQGAAGFVAKESTRSEIVNAVLDCARGSDG